MTSYTASYNKEIDRTKYEEHFEYVFIDENSCEHLVNYSVELNTSNVNVEITGVEYCVNNDGIYRGSEIKMIGKIIKKHTTITLINLTNYITIKQLICLNSFM